MHLCKCSVCHSNISIFSLVTDEAASEFLAEWFPLEKELRRAATMYLALFQPPKQNMNFPKGLRLLKEVIALEQDKAKLTLALSITADAIIESRQSGDEFEPLKNHKYLLKVLKNNTDVQRLVTQNQQASQLPPSHQPATEAMKTKTGKAMQSLQSMKVPT